MKTKYLFKVLGCLAAFTLLLFQSCSDETADFDSSVNSYDQELEKSLSNYEVVRIDYESFENLAKSNPSGYEEVNLNIPSKPDWNFQLTHDDLSEDQAPDFKVFLVGENDALEEQQIPVNYALKGKLANSELESFFIFGEGQFEGSIVDKGQEYYIEPVSNFAENVDKNLYVVYNVNDVISDSLPCSADDSKVEGGAQQSIKGNANRPWKVEITMVGDYQLYKKFNNWSRAYNYLYYRNYYTNRVHSNNRTAARTLVKTIYIYTSYSSRNYYPNSPYLGTALNQVQNYYYASWFNKGDLNYFVTGDYIADYAGMAWLGTICANPSLSFGIGKYYSAGTLANNLMAHETGHNMGMPHDTSGPNIMYPTLNYGSTFTQSSKWYLQTTLNNQSSCLNY